ncbi:hypothetical protein [Klebsiella michiganensis]|uniref:hypothetical protein n=1 Tax=Klebsiella michiganensis TaxID=1134687 RepID=UPI001CC30BE5|nr:hypothetical protein [Klebsiella michiganensis]
MAEPVIFGNKNWRPFINSKNGVTATHGLAIASKCRAMGLGQMAGLSLFYRLRDWQFDTRDLHARDPFKAVTEVGFSVRYLTVGFFILLYQLAVLSLVREKVTFVDRPERFKANKHNLALKHAPVRHQIRVCRFTAVQTNQKHEAAVYKMMGQYSTHLIETP